MCVFDASTYQANTWHQVNECKSECNDDTRRLPGCYVHQEVMDEDMSDFFLINKCIPLQLNDQ